MMRAFTFLSIILMIVALIVLQRFSDQTELETWLTPVSISLRFDKNITYCRYCTSWSFRNNTVRFGYYGGMENTAGRKRGSVAVSLIRLAHSRFDLPEYDYLSLYHQDFPGCEPKGIWLHLV